MSLSQFDLDLGRKSSVDLKCAATRDVRFVIALHDLFKKSFSR